MEGKEAGRDLVMVGDVMESSGTLLVLMVLSLVVVDIPTTRQKITTVPSIFFGERAKLKQNDSETIRLFHQASVGRGEGCPA